MTASKGFELNLNIDRVKRSTHAAAERGVLKAAEHVLQISNQRVPIEEGTLERSGAASAEGLKGTVSYDTPYAVRQHEDMSYRHDAGRQAKFLESALTGEREKVLRVVGDELRGEFQ